MSRILKLKGDIKWVEYINKDYDKELYKKIILDSDGIKVFVTSQNQQYTTTITNKFITTENLYRIDPHKLLHCRIHDGLGIPLEYILYSLTTMLDITSNKPEKFSRRVITKDMIFEEPVSISNMVDVVRDIDEFLIEAED